VNLKYTTKPTYINLLQPRTFRGGIFSMFFDFGDNFYSEEEIEKIKSSEEKPMEIKEKTIWKKDTKKELQYLLLKIHQKHEQKDASEENFVHSINVVSDYISYWLKDEKDYDDNHVLFLTHSTEFENYLKQSMLEQIVEKKSFGIYCKINPKVDIEISPGRNWTTENLGSKVSIFSTKIDITNFDAFKSFSKFQTVFSGIIQKTYFFEINETKESEPKIKSEQNNANKFCKYFNSSNYSCSKKDCAFLHVKTSEKLSPLPILCSKINTKSGCPHGADDCIFLHE
jgi:hypothetical protein